MRILWLGENPSGNWGDLALSVATERWLAHMWPGIEIVRAPRRPEWSRPGADLSYVSDLGIRPDDVIVLQGGSDFGDLYAPYPWHDILRELVQLPNPIVQLPVTVYYQAAQSMARDREIMSGRRNILVAAREPVSLGRLRGLGVPAMLVPDITFGLPHGSPGFSVPRQGVLGVMRDDWEAALNYYQMDNALKSLGVTTLIDHMGAPSDGSIADLLVYYRSFRAVVTDRFHGMVFALLAGTPCVALPMRIAHKAQGMHPMIGRGVLFGLPGPSDFERFCGEPVDPLDFSSYFAQWESAVKQHVEAGQTCTDG